MLYKNCMLSLLLLSSDDWRVYTWGRADYGQTGRLPLNAVPGPLQQQSN